MSSMPRIEPQQGELNGVETYLSLAKIVHNKKDAETFVKMAADEGRHAAICKKYTGVSLSPKKGQATLAVYAYRILGKRILYPFIAIGEYIAIPKYEKLMKEFPELESVKNDEKRHGDTVLSLLKNGQYNDRPLLPYILGAVAAFVIVKKIVKLFSRESLDI
ncbi:MAG: rubrerythrin [Lachnospiraceae bacterium]|nr:rubrerythrin [Lachnospiraceae bacterium]